MLTAARPDAVAVARPRLAVLVLGQPGGHRPPGPDRIPGAGALAVIEGPAGLALESGGVSYQILGQLAWFVRERLTTADPRRVPAAVEALFRTDLELKSSGGDPRVLLERLVVDLCRR